MESRANLTCDISKRFALWFDRAICRSPDGALYDSQSCYVGLGCSWFWRPWNNLDDITMAPGFTLGSCCWCWNWRDGTCLRRIGCKSLVRATQRASNWWIDCSKCDRTTYISARTFLPCRAPWLEECFNNGRLRCFRNDSTHLYLS